MSVIFETSLGDLTIDLFLEEAPKACENFLKLCKTKYYDHCLFFDIQKDFCVQCGDPTNTGEGGSSIWGVLNGPRQRYIDDEISPKLKHNKKGIVAMATTGRDMIASQFYITTSTYLPRLDGKHTIIGEVVEGLDTLDKINEAVVDLTGRPVQVLRIQHTIILEDPFPDPPGLKIPDRSPSPPKNWPFGMLPEDLDNLQESEESRREHLAAEAAKAKAEALVLLGELPDADVRPPDNVLFVCKLNPATTGRSLGIFFSRFGKVLASDVIMDRHGQSLCYAFVEFDNRESTEEAYLKMQNVLIDDRRIHVDFCQSVSKTEQFRAAGGWKRFFADRARGFNAPSSGNLEMKRGSHLPLQFTHQRSQPRTNSHQQPQHYEDRGRPRYEDDRTRHRDDPRHHRSHDRRDYQSDRRDYDDHQRREHRPYDSRDEPPSRKRPGSPLRDDPSYKRSKYSESSNDRGRPY